MTHPNPRPAYKFLVSDAIVEILTVTVLALSGLVSLIAVVSA